MNYGHNNFGANMPSYLSAPVYMPSNLAQAGQPQVKTNRILVTSLQEALARPCDLGSEMYYWDQSRPVIYVVRTSLQGVKDWAEIPYVVNQQNDNTPATKAEVQELRNEIAALKGKLGAVGNPQSGQEVNTNVEQPVG